MNAGSDHAAGGSADAGLHAELAAELHAAAGLGRAVPPLSTRHPGLTLDDAYAIQTALRGLTCADGASCVGHKIGATSEAIRTMFGIDHPDFGFLTDEMLLPDGIVVDPARFIAPKVEGELAFRLDDDLFGESVTAADVLERTGEVLPVLEILDSRIANWAIGLVDTVADNASSAAVVCGAGVALHGGDLSHERMTLEVDGVVHTAGGDAVLGGPAESVAWLVRLLARYGGGLHAGEIVLAGAWTAACDLRPGSSARVTFETFGSVGLTVGIAA